MNYISDLHTHTIVSGHAYSTLLENISEASRKGLKILGSAEHGPKMPGGPHIFYFGNLKVIPREMNGVKILKGCEANIIDFEGNIDIPERILKKLDYVIASLHDVCIEPGSIEENTNAIIKVMDNPYVDIIGHPGNPSFPIYEEEIVKKAKEKNILLEINNSSFVSSRKGSEDTCSKIAKLCKKYGTRIIINSDAHFATAVGDFKEAEAILKSVGMPEELIINKSEKEVLNYLKNKGKVLDIAID
ncbi:phosphatase [Haloimpatiens massiliensis]|uniref:phosphatase n=1 Tax=Haloimpatiens massiliensis TaxID=1658110 RepID=UPI000C8384DA|nr:phosphatase [Haloimpatiens massiliensis]